MIYYVRHGQSESNVHLHEGGEWIYEVHNDAPLTAEGRRQAEETGERLRDTKIDVVVTSGLSRARDTGAIINQFHGVPVVVMEELNERVDRRVGTMDSGGRDEEWHKSFEFGYEAYPGIERLEDFRDRVMRAIKRIEKEYEGKNVLVAAHGGVSYVFRRYCEGGKWEGNIRDTVRMKNAEVVEFDLKGLKG